MDSRQQSAGMTKGDSLDFCFFVPVLNSFQYQDKEDRKKVNTNEGEAYEDSVPELLDIYNCEGLKSPEAICCKISRAFRLAAAYTVVGLQIASLTLAMTVLRRRVSLSI